MKKELLFLILMVLMISVEAKADKSGSCGDNLSYYFNDATSTLTISGTGSMKNYSHDPSSSEKSPWYSYRSKIEKVIIEPGVTSVGTSAFYHSINIKTVIFPNSINKIYNYAFSYCSALESIDLPPNMSFIAQEAFYNCTSISSVSIESIEKIYVDAFYNCGNIQYVNIKSIEDWCKIWFQGKNSNPLTFAGHLFVNGVEVKDLVIPNSIKYICDCAFYNCAGLLSVSIPNGVTEIGQSAFSGCYNLSTLTIPNTVKTIVNNAFERCTGLTKIILGQNIELIREYCFQACTSLKDFYCYAEVPPKMRNDIFYNTPYSNAILHVPSGAIDKYKQKEPWKHFKKIVETDVMMYSLKYIIDDNEYISFSIMEGESITPIQVPEKEGYTFGGWSEIPETMPAHDVIVTGTFAINKYKLSYKVDGAEYKSYELEFGAKITPEPTPTKEGYTFSGWSEIPETMPAHDVTINGSFTINSYKLTYIIDDKVYKETMYEYGATITPEPQPEGDYATFEWIDIPKKMPAHDVVVHASYTSGITEALMTTQRNIRIYSPNGMKLNKLQRGLNIVVLEDGTVREIVVK